MIPLELAKLTALMERTSGSPEVKIGLIDGPIVTQHPDLVGEHLREIPGNNGAMCTRANSTACLHGTFVAGILSAKRNSPAPAICPDCTLLIRPIFAEKTTGSEHMPSATPQELAAAIIECIDAGASDQPEPCPCAAFHQRGTVLGRGAQSGRQAERDRGRGGGQSRHPRQFRHHPSSMDHPGGSLRSSRQTDERVESGQFDRQARLNRTR